MSPNFQFFFFSYERLKPWNIEVGIAMVSFQLTIIILLPFCIEMLQYDWLWSGHMIIKEMFHIPMKLKPELARQM